MSLTKCRLTARLLSSGSLRLASAILLATGSNAQTLYDFGNPTAEEQLYVELINRARANPAAEGARLAATTDVDVVTAMNHFSVNKTMMQSEFNALPVTPPLAPNANLTAAARGHSSWMLINGTQSHNQPTNTPGSRITAAGYSASSVSENIYAFSKSTWFGHAGFQVDWGTGGTGGMQAGRGHRVAIHHANLREIGVGVQLGTNTGPSGTVGPQLVTQDFGTQSSNPTFGTGVVYYDLNSNNFYDSGEGISGLTVNINGASHYCTTAVGGGWVVPVPTTAATRTVTFSGLNVNQTSNLTFAANTNAKLDLKLTYTPPSITSAATASSGAPHNLTFTTVKGATAYEWNVWNPAPAAAENCNSASTITSSTTGTYSVYNTAVKHEGTGSFKLENSTGSNQSFELNAVYYGGASPSLSFQSSLRYAAVAETFKVQVKEEGTTVWSDVYSQAGTNDPGSTAFVLRSAALAGMTGKAFRIRFLLNSGGSYYNLSGNTYGWFIDSINFTEVYTPQNHVKQTLFSNSGSFSPTAGTYIMAVAPIISGKPFAAGYQTLVVPASSSPTITSQPTSVTINSGNTTTFSVTATGAPLSYQWYQGNSGVTTNPITSATSSSYTTPTLTANTNYWVRVSNTAGFTNSNTVTATVITPPTITSQPSSITIHSGNTATFSVTATGASLSYQWYRGNSGATTNLIASATSSSYTTPTLTANTTYWVRVSNAAGTIDSNTATATVTNLPIITSQPTSVTIGTGNTATFSVTATGASLSYQWYRGNSGTTTNKITSATSSSYTTPALTANTNYWVRISNSAGRTNSNTVTASVTTLPNITSQPASVTINSGTTATFSVTATGASLSYQWYRGSSGVTTNPIASATSSSYNATALTQTTSYWVRVSNSGGQANSNTATATVIVPPVISNQPDSTQIIRGQSATLLVEATGTTPNYQWYEGTTGNTTKPVAGATSAILNTPILTTDATYWVRAANSAGSAASNTAIISVTDAFTNWARNLEIANSLPLGTLSNPTGDADNDGKSNLVEYAFGTSPVNGNEPSPRMPVPTTTSTDFVLRYQRDTSLLGIQLTPQACPGLGDWKAPGSPGAPAGFTDTLITTAGSIETREAKLPLSSGSNWFMRIHVSQN